MTGGFPYFINQIPYSFKPTRKFPTLTYCWSCGIQGGHCKCDKIFTITNNLYRFMWRDGSDGDWNYWENNEEHPNNCGRVCIYCNRLVYCCYRRCFRCKSCGLNGRECYCHKPLPDDYHERYPSRMY